MLELVDVTKRYGDNTVLDHISLTVENGQIVSILGPSGGGKTTLLNVLLGITEVSSGKIVYNGEDITNVSMEKRGFNIVFQDYALFPNLNAYDNITYGLRNNPGISSAGCGWCLLTYRDISMVGGIRSWWSCWA